MRQNGHTGAPDRPSRIVAVYPSTQGLSQAYLRRAVDRTLAALPRLPDPLPARLRGELELVDVDRAWRDVHQPPDEAALQRALRRLKFDEFLLLEYAGVPRVATELDRRLNLLDTVVKFQTVKLEEAVDPDSLPEPVEIHAETTAKPAQEAPSEADEATGAEDEESDELWLFCSVVLMRRFTQLIPI